MTTSHLEVLGVEGIGEVVAGDDVAGIILAAVELRDGDVVVVSSKVISKAAGRTVVVPEGVDPDIARRRIAAADEVLAETPHVVIVRTPSGLVCANAGIDASNVPDGVLLLLPEDPDADAAALREAIRSAAGVDVGVVVADTFGRAWRQGQTDVAIGVAGMPAVRDERGRTDREGRTLSVTLIAVADQVAGAADLVRHKSAGLPVVVLRGLDRGDPREWGTGADLVRRAEEDLFAHGRGWLATRLAEGPGRSAASRPGVPSAAEWALVRRAAGEGAAPDAGHRTMVVSDGLSAGRAEAALLDLGFEVDVRAVVDGYAVSVR